MYKTLTAAIIIVASTTVAGQASAQTECYTGWYQGAPIDVCPPPIPDPTNCYTGWYQGAPQEVCMPTGWVPPTDWTFNGEPLVIHVSKDYVAPVADAPPNDVIEVRSNATAAPAIGSAREAWAPETIRQAEPRS